MARARLPRTRVMIVDDHELARAGLRRLLARASGIELVGEASSGTEALALCRRLRPDLVIMDVRLSDMDGLTATRALVHAHPMCRVLLFTMYEAEDYLRESMRAGAVGYVLKGASRHELLSAIRAAMSTELRSPGDAEDPPESTRS